MIVTQRQQLVLLVVAGVVGLALVEAHVRKEHRLLKVAGTTIDTTAARGVLEPVPERWAWLRRMWAPRREEMRLWYAVFAEDCTGAEIDKVVLMIVDCSGSSRALHSCVQFSQ